jgi:hypothetical protein
MRQQALARRSLGGGGSDSVGESEGRSPSDRLGAPRARLTGAEWGFGGPASDRVGESEGRSPSDLVR